MASSVRGSVPDQTWAQSLPGYFQQNIQPQIYDGAYLIPHVNPSLPNLVSLNTVGENYNRGYIDKPVPRASTIRHAIENPSTYVQRLHPSDLTSGTGGIDNLSNLYRFGHPLPMSNGEDFLDTAYWASQEVRRDANDPLSAGYATRVIGPYGDNLVQQYTRDQATKAAQEKYRSRYSAFVEAQMAKQRQGMVYDSPEELLKKDEEMIKSQVARDLSERDASGTVQLSPESNGPSTPASALLASNQQRLEKVYISGYPSQLPAGASYSNTLQPFGGMPSNATTITPSYGSSTNASPYDQMNQNTDPRHFLFQGRSPATPFASRGFSAPQANSDVSVNARTNQEQQETQNSNVYNDGNYSTFEDRQNLGGQSFFRQRQGVSTSGSVLGVSRSQGGDGDVVLDTPGRPGGRASLVNARRGSDASYEVLSSPYLF